VASQVTGEYQVREEYLQQYVQLVLEKMKEFEIVEVTHIPRELNTRAYILSKLASTRRLNFTKSTQLLGWKTREDLFPATLLVENSLLTPMKERS